MQTIAITGASGFLGRHLLARCLSQGGIDISILTRAVSRIKDASDNVNIVEGDLLRPGSLIGFLAGRQTLVHLAYIKNGLDRNLDATNNLIESVVECGVKRVVHCSTAVVVGPRARGVVNEDIIPEPQDEYQQIKFKIEQMLLHELRGKAEVAILRPTEVIGPGGEGLRTMIDRLNNHGAFTRFAYRILLKNRRFNYVSVYNVVEALLLLASTNETLCGEIFNISDDDDDENCYAAIEKIICSCNNIRCARPFDAGLPRSILSYLFRFMPNCSSPDIVYSCNKIRSLGYKKAATLGAVVAEIAAKPCCIENQDKGGINE